MNVQHIFDGIDDKTVEDNIAIAENTINQNIRKGTLTRAQLEKLPYLRDGLEVTTDYVNVDANKDVSGSDAVIHLYFRNDGSVHYVAGILNGDGTFCFYNSDANSTRPMTWEEYFKKANENTDMVYSCTYNVKRK